jgi:hypothetical protein
MALGSVATGLLQRGAAQVGTAPVLLARAFGEPNAITVRAQQPDADEGQDVSPETRAQWP